LKPHAQSWVAEMIGADEWTTDTPHGSTITVHRNQQGRLDFLRNAERAGFKVDGNIISGGTPQEIRNAVWALLSPPRKNSEA
jgi:hypothetical protein